MLNKAVIVGYIAIAAATLVGAMEQKTALAQETSADAIYSSGGLIGPITGPPKCAPGPRCEEEEFLWAQCEIGKGGHFGSILFKEK